MQDLYAYYYGDENISITGGLSAYAYRRNGGTSLNPKTPTLVKESNRLNLSITTDTTYTWYAGTLFIEKPIDLTNFTSIEILINGVANVSGNTNGHVNAYLTTSKINDYNYTHQTPIASDGTTSMDVADLKGEYYFCIQIASGKGTTSLNIESVKFIK